MAAKNDDINSGLKALYVTIYVTNEKFNAAGFLRRMWLYARSPLSTELAASVGLEKESTSFHRNSSICHLLPRLIDL